MTSFCSDRLRGFQHGSEHTDEYLAAQLGVTPETVRAWSDGRMTTAPNDLAAVATALDVEVEDLAPTGQGAWWDYASAVALCAGPRPEDVLRALADLLSDADSTGRHGAERQSVAA